MQKILLVVLGLMLLASPTKSQTVDEIITNYQKNLGGIDKLKAIKSMRTTAKFTGGGGFEARMIIENKRPNLIRTDLIIQGLNGIEAHDGKKGWKIEPWQGKKDAELMNEDELKSLIEQADMDGPLIDYKEKGHKVEFIGKEDFEGTETYKLKVTLKDGNTNVFYLDADRFSPIKIDTKQIIRGAEQEAETVLGDYKEVAGVYLPYSAETGPKGSQNKAKITIEKIEVNLALDDKRFIMPAAATSEQPKKTPEDSNVPQKQPNTNKPGATPTAQKPPTKQ